MSIPIGVDDRGVRGMCDRHEGALLVLGAAAAVCIRCVIALSPYSGEGTPPMYGDYEAQRHWMEITSALPVLQWYENSTDNDLLYWGLDYPPLTAYHSYALGYVGTRLVPDCFELGTSRGHESKRCRFFMRASVVLSDLAVYLPSALFAVRSFEARPGPSGGGPAGLESAPARLAAVCGLWLLPPLLLIDHGHFQYNGVCFGLCLAAAGCVARGWILAASVLFVAGLLFKQIALFFALAFFFGILAACKFQARSTSDSAGRVAITGAVVLLTAGLLFGPWLFFAPHPVRSAGQVLHRMFPFSRGLFEDKVANIWCSISVVVKLHRIMPPKTIPTVCALATLVALLPACAHCLRYRAAGRGAFAAALVASAFAFFLFSFQVHEKAVLFPCVAAMLLPTVLGPLRRPPWTTSFVCHFLLVCMFSMYPLVVKDGLHLAYGVLCAALLALCEVSMPPDPVALLPATMMKHRLRDVIRLTYIAGTAIHGIHAFVPHPARYPDAWTLLITGSSCAYFIACFVALTVAQLRGAFDSGEEPTIIKED